MIAKFFNNILITCRYIFFLVATLALFYGFYMMYIASSFSVYQYWYIFLPCAVIFIFYIIDLFISNDFMENNILFNFVSVLSFLFIIGIVLRARFDSSLLLYVKYNISFNVTFFLDNLNYILIVLCILIFVNVLLFIYAIVDREKKDVIATKVDDY